MRAALMQHLDSELQKPAIAYIDSAQTSINMKQSFDYVIGLDPGIQSHQLALHYLQTVVVGNIHSAMDSVIDAVENGLPVSDAYLNVLLPAQVEVGRLWHANKLSIAEEHLVTTTTHRLMAVLAQMVEREDNNGNTLVAAAVSGNAHELGIRTITYLLEFDGWKTIYLGSDVPAADLPVTINCFNAELVLLSIGLSSQLKSLRKTIEQIRDKSDRPVKIMVGGNGFAGAPHLWREVGADGFASSAEQALLMAQELVDQI
jgi:methanogenic corrinoid protein MtbC1